MPSGTIISPDLGHIHYQELKITGTFGFEPASFRKALDLLSSGDLDVDGFITGTVPLLEVREAIIAAGRYQGIKTVVEMDAA